jgi:hypothetical protein
LDTLVAPVALYPDALLSQVLVAATYPLEIVEAGQWLQQNRNLQGPQLVDAARQQNWDASVQALVAFPDVVVTLNQDVQWTTSLGNAFLAQQPDVMAAVQRLRARAQANGRLSSNAQQTVSTETQGGQAAIDIAPADPQVIYVPQYDPAYIWGQPAWGYYPPLYYGGYGFGYYPGIDIGFCFGGWGGWGWGGRGWGWGPNWFGGSVFVNGGFFNRYGYRGGLYAGGFGGRAAWQHDAGHRLGVSYPNGRLTARYGAASLASRSAMTRSSSLNSTRSAGSGSWNRFGSGAEGARNTAPRSSHIRGPVATLSGCATQPGSGAAKFRPSATVLGSGAAKFRSRPTLFGSRAAILRSRTAVFGSGATVFCSSTAIFSSRAGLPVSAANVRTELQLGRAQLRRRWRRRWRLTQLWQRRRGAQLWRRP